MRKCRQRDTTDDDTEETLHSENDSECELSVHIHTYASQLLDKVRPSV